MSIERLAPDFLTSLGATDSTQSSGIFGESYVEAPAIFKRNGIYYAVFGPCCCYCESGSVVSYYTASSPLGPYTRRGVLAARRHFGSQQTDIFSYTDSAGAPQFLYIGDHWQSAPDRLKSHDFTVWAPLAFSADGNITTNGFEEEFTIDVKVYQYE
jgi:hypothetical protein